MSRIAFTALLLGSLGVGALAAPPARQVFTGRIKDLRGTAGTLTLAVEEGRRVTDRTFLIIEARIVGRGGAEWKLEDLRDGDLVQVEMARGGRLVQEVRVLPAGAGHRAGPRGRAADR
jgi:hypothetical protein